MKILPSSLREKKRYIAFEVISESNEPIDRKALLDEIFFATQTLMGDEGSSEIGYRLMDFNGSMGIIKVNLNAVEMARAAMGTVCYIKGSRAAVKSAWSGRNDTVGHRKIYPCGGYIFH